MKCLLCEEPLPEKGVTTVVPTRFAHWFEATSPDGCRVWCNEEMLTRRGLTPPPPPSKESSDA